MNFRNLYINQTTMLANGLANIGVDQFFGYEQPDSLEAEGGYLIGQGIMDLGSPEKKLISIPPKEFKDPFLKRCYAFGLALSNLKTPQQSLVTNYEPLIFDSNMDVKRCSIISLGLSSLGSGDKELVDLFRSLKRDPYWRIRSAVGLGSSFAFLGIDEFFEEAQRDIISEQNPYVKVSSAWYLSLASASRRQQISRYLELLDGEDVFLRDMAALGIGYADLGEADQELLDRLRRVAIGDPHPYVRESACYGLSLLSFQNHNKTFGSTIHKALKDYSPTVRSGAALSVGIADFKQNSIDYFPLILEEHDPSVRWGFILGAGLSGCRNPALEKLVDAPLVRWGRELSFSFIDGSERPFGPDEEGLVAFQNQVNAGLYRTRLKEKDSFRLLYPGVYYNIMYESFWWGLWVLSELGACLWRKSHVEV